MSTETTRETPEEAVRQVIASGRLEGAPDPTPAEYEQLLAVARGEMTADEAIAAYVDHIEADHGQETET